MNAEYHKARRTLTLISALMIGWQYIGISIGSSIKIPQTENAINVAHPEVLQIVLLVLLLYFAARLAIEWFQCPYDQRNPVPARLDMGLTATIASLAVVMFAVQSLSGVTIANTFNAHNVGMLVGLLIVPFYMAMVQYGLRRVASHPRRLLERGPMRSLRRVAQLPRYYFVVIGTVLNAIACIIVILVRMFGDPDFPVLGPRGIVSTWVFLAGLSGNLFIISLALYAKKLTLRSSADNE